MRNWCGGEPGGGKASGLGRGIAILVCNREQGVLRVLGMAKATGAAMLVSRPEYIAAT